MIQISNEESVSAHPLLGDREVHVWRIAIGRDGSEALALLSEEERARAAAYGSVKAREAFVACRGALRGLLARYAGVKSEEIVFGANLHGKPMATGPAGAARIHFNISHAGDRALLAFSKMGAVGIDIERESRERDPLAFAKRFFSEAEQAVMLATPEVERAALFARYWTRREAWFKGLGTGMEFSMIKSFDAHFDSSASIVRDATDAEGARSRWVLMDLEPGGGYAAALAVNAADAGVVVRQFRR